MNIPAPHLYFSGICGLLMLGFVLVLIRNHRLQERYASLWILLALVFMTYGWWIRPVKAVSDIFRITDVVPVVLFFGIFMCALLILQLSITISEFSTKIKNLVQEVSLLKHEMEHRRPDMSETRRNDDGHF